MIYCFHRTLNRWIAPTLNCSNFVPIGPFSKVFGVLETSDFLVSSSACSFAHCSTKAVQFVSNSDHQSPSGSSQIEILSLESCSRDCCRPKLVLCCWVLTEQRLFQNKTQNYTQNSKPESLKFLKHQKLLKTVQ